MEGSSRISELDAPSKGGTVGTTKLLPLDLDVLGVMLLTSIATRLLHPIHE